MSYMNEAWFVLLASAVTNSSREQIAQKLGVSRTAISLVMSGKYPANTQKISVKVLALLDGWHCPYLGADISAKDCNTVHASPTPSHDPAQLAHRRVCRNCPNKPKQGE